MWTTTYFHFDGIGSTRQITDGLQNVTDTYVYNAYGEEIGRTGTSVNHLRFAGRVGYYFDGDSVTYYVRARSYQAALARWTSRDPVDTALYTTPYAYIDNAPTRSTDPSGNEAIYVPGRVVLIDAVLTAVAPANSNGPQWLESEIHASWQVNASAFVDRRGKAACEEIGVVQIYNDENDGRGPRNWFFRRGWRLDIPSSSSRIWYPTPNNAAEPTHGDPLEVARLSFWDQPGDQAIFSGFGEWLSRLNKASTHFETYVVGIRGKEGIRTEAIPNAIVFRSVHVYSAIKWHHEFVHTGDGKYSRSRQITSRVPGDMSNLETALHRHYDTTWSDTP